MRRHLVRLYAKQFKSTTRVLALILAMIVMALCSVVSFAAGVYDAYNIERVSVNNGNYTPFIYNSLDDAPSSGGSVPFMTKVQTLIESTGATIAWWEGIQGRTSGVFGYTTYSWEAAVGETETVYWLLTTYVLTSQKDNEITFANTYKSTGIDLGEQVGDTLAGSFSLGVATVSVTCAVYSSSAVEGGKNISTTLNVNFVSGSYAQDGMFFPVVVPRYYTSQDQALIALEGIQSTLDDIADGLFGDYSDSELDGIQGDVSSLGDRAESIGAALEISDVSITNPSTSMGQAGISSINNVFTIIFANDWVVYLVTLSLGLVALKLILYGKKG